MTETPHITRRACRGNCGFAGSAYDMAQHEAQCPAFRAAWPSGRYDPPDPVQGRLIALRDKLKKGLAHVLGR